MNASGAGGPFVRVVSLGEMRRGGQRVRALGLELHGVRARALQPLERHLVSDSGAFVLGPRLI